MPAKKDPAPPVDKWQSFGHVKLDAAEAVECGWTPEEAVKALAPLLDGRASLTAAEARVALDALPGNGASDDRALAAQIAEELLDYRIERGRVAAYYQPIRQTRVNLKKMLKSEDVTEEMTVDLLRVLARELGWNVREDEEGVTVPVDALLPFYRRPIVRQLLDAKMRQVGLARVPEPAPESVTGDETPSPAAAGGEQA